MLKIEALATQTWDLQHHGSIAKHESSVPTVPFFWARWRHTNPAVDHR